MNHLYVTARILCWSFTLMRQRQLQVKDLPKVPWLFRRRASNLPMHHYTPRCVRWSSVSAFEFRWRTIGRRIVTIEIIFFCSDRWGWWLPVWLCYGFKLIRADEPSDCLSGTSDYGTVPAAKILGQRPGSNRPSEAASEPGKWRHPALINICNSLLILIINLYSSASGGSDARMSEDVSVLSWGQMLTC